MAPFGWFCMLLLCCSALSAGGGTEFRDADVVADFLEHGFELHADAQGVIGNANDVGRHPYALREIDLGDIVWHGGRKAWVRHLMHNGEGVEAAAPAGLPPCEFRREAM